ncbi:MAG TPA: hypothetical protein VK935_08815 [Actinomycetospora sp.]|nr:hypothetical protein [Actinomycetospora sp.]
MSIEDLRWHARRDWEWLEAAADVVQRARLTTLLLPGIGTIAELRREGVRAYRDVSTRRPNSASTRTRTSPCRW